MVSRSKRQRTVGLAAGCLVTTAAVAWAAIPLGDVRVGLESVASGLVAPVSATHAGDGSGRLFVVDQVGRIRIVENGVLLATPFLDITDRMVTLNTGYDERGLLGLAFHPDYVHNGRFFVRYSAPRAGAPGDPCFGTSRGCHSEVLSEFAVTANPNVADPDSEVILFSIAEPQFNHNSGTVAFAPDGYLYFPLGDGGGANDGLADNPPSHGPIGNAQNLATALGKLLRIDVDSGSPYAIPPDNPFVGAPGLDEIYAYGFRNPYQISFDDGPGGDGTLYLADVGQNLFEELDIITAGGNYGWVIKEGFHCFDPFNPATPPATCDDDGMIDPIVEYSHSDGGLAIIGGHVYRGTTSPSLQGRYIFGDFSANFGPTGRLYYLAGSTPLNGQVRELRLGQEEAPLGKFLKGIGEDEEGELYALVTATLGPTGSTGEVYRILGLPFGDGNADRDVDLDDYDALFACLSGPGVSYDFDGLNTTNVSVGPNFDFIPADVTIEIGDTIHWFWAGGLHNVESGVDGAYDGNFRSGNATSSTATVFDVTFNAAFLAAHPMPGNYYPYYCIVHFVMGMVGSVTVEPDACVVFDIDEDGDVDLKDVAVFQNSFTGAP
ncbi:MAG TPA: PQQ-dependent sugar dehydrogenase [Phycisphaerae bacterium]|nr:PQQ-dependent sugar dehydrogenase [Phycisphaerae bacterium]